MPNMEEMEKFKRISPITYVENVTKPTQLHVGFKDRRVPSQQGVLWFKALLERNVTPVEFVSYKNDNHAIEKPKSNEIMWTKTVEFIKKYIVDQ